MVQRKCWGNDLQGKPKHFIAAKQWARTLEHVNCIRKAAQVIRRPRHVQNFDIADDRCPLERKLHFLPLFDLQHKVSKPCRVQTGRVASTAGNHLGAHDLNFWQSELDSVRNVRSRYNKTKLARMRKMYLFVAVTQKCNQQVQQQNQDDARQQQEECLPNNTVGGAVDVVEIRWVVRPEEKRLKHVHEDSTCRPTTAVFWCHVWPVEIRGKARAAWKQ